MTQDPLTTRKRLAQAGRDLEDKIATDKAKLAEQFRKIEEHAANARKLLEQDDA